MGYETVSFNSVSNYHTPNIDRLAQEGFVFTNCDAQPLCCPTRIKLMSGQLNYRNYKGWGSFDLEFPAIGKIMQQAGYATGVFGKWHMNKSPEDMGFDEHSLFMGSPGDLPYPEFFNRYFYNCPIVEDGKDTVVAYSPDRFNQRVLSFIDDYKKQPFFIYYPLSLAHNPFEPTPDSRDSTSEVWQKNFEDMVGYADKMIGNVVEKLKREGLYENTIIFYTADNGTKTLAHYMENGEVIFGGKGTMRVDGVHVPLVVKYDGTHKILDDLVDFSDFYPTIASLADIPREALSKQIDGVSLHPLLKNEIRESKPFIFSVFFHPLNAYIRDKDYKYYLDGRLYHIQKDPGELQPYYLANDTKTTSGARERLKKELTRLLENTELSEYDTKNKLVQTFGKIDENQNDKRLLATYIFDELKYTPRKELISLNIADYLSKDGEKYRLEFSRAHRSTNSGLTYADFIIKSVKIVQDNKTVFTKKLEGMELTTRRNVEMLRENGNPIISFTKEGDHCTVSLDKISNPFKTHVYLEVELEVANPGNQYGKQVMLYLYLVKE